MKLPRSLLGPPNPRDELRGQNTGGILPSLRTTYPAHIARALHALAESRPTPAHYAAERARILNYDRKTSERTEQR